MTIKINNISLTLDEDLEFLKERIAKKLKLSQDNIIKYTILRESLDARKKDNIKFNYSVEVFIEKEEQIVNSLRDNDVQLYKTAIREKIIFGNKKLNTRPIVVGMGPAGMFAALELAKNGYRPLVIERGEAIENRTKTVNNFWKSGILNSDSNVQFGEGGAGTFSDGSLLQE